MKFFALFFLISLCSSMAMAEIVVSCNGGDLLLDHYVDHYDYNFEKWTATFNGYNSTGAGVINYLQGQRHINFAEHRNGDPKLPQISGFVQSGGSLSTGLVEITFSPARGDGQRSLTIHFVGSTPDQSANWTFENCTGQR